MADAFKFEPGRGAPPGGYRPRFEGDAIPFGSTALLLLLLLLLPAGLELFNVLSAAGDFALKVVVEEVFC